MRLYLVRHGNAGPGVYDEERRLSSSGEQEADRLGLFLSRFGDRVGVIFHSDLVRARETALSIARKIPVDSLQERCDLRPGDSAASFASSVLVHEHDRDVMVVGHLPFVAELASLLLDGCEEAVRVRFTTGSLLCLERDWERWILRYHLPADVIACFVQG